QTLYYCKYHIKYINACINQQQQVAQSNEYEQAKLIDEELVRTMDNDEMCNVYRNELANDKKITVLWLFGYILILWHSHRLC
ncbi:unnamed protein product, partial [Rotaria sp. Silwood2]